MTETSATIKVSRGNCPCLHKPPRELATGPDGFVCTQDPSRCTAEDLAAALPPDLGHDQHLRAPPWAGEDHVRLRLSSLLSLFDGDLGNAFLLVSSERVRPHIAVVADVPQPVHELTWEGIDSRWVLIDWLAEWRAAGRRCSVLWVVEDEFEHYLPEHLIDVKLAAIPFFSAPFTAWSLRRYLAIIAETDYRAELALEERLITYLDAADQLVLRTPSLGAICTFRHHEAEHWFSLHGPLQFGDQTVLPTGELSTLADASGDYRTDTRISLSGELVLKGSPIVHRGDRTVTAQATRDMYARLSPMEDLPVIAHVRNGLIEAIEAPSRASRRLRDTFTALLEAEPRYRKVHEFGLGTHRGCQQRLRHNFHPNERWPGIHVGLGLGGYTPFHLDLALSEVQVLLDIDGAGLTALYPALGFDRP